MSKGQAATKQKTAAARPGSVRASAAPKKASEPKKAAGSKVEPKIEPKIATKIEPKITSKFTSKIAPKLAPRAEAKSEPKAEHKKISEEKGMASKVAVATKAKAKEQDAAPSDKETPETPESPLPLLDLSDAAVKKMIKLAKKRGYVTHEQLNAVLPSEEVSSEQIEDILAMLNEMGINTVEQEETENEEEEKPAEEAEEEEASDGEVVEVAHKP